MIHILYDLADGDVGIRTVFSHRTYLKKLHIEPCSVFLMFDICSKLHFYIAHQFLLAYLEYILENLCKRVAVIFEECIERYHAGTLCRYSRKHPVVLDAECGRDKFRM